MQVQFLQDVAAMSLDGVGANVESCCYFLVRRAGLLKIWWLCTMRTSGRGVIFSGV